MWKFFIYILILLQNHTSADEDSPIITEDQWEWLARRTDIHRPNHFDPTDTSNVPTKPQPVGPSVVNPTKPHPVGPSVFSPTKPHPVGPSVDTSNPSEVGPIPETKSDIVYFQYADSPKVPLANFDLNAGGRRNIYNINVAQQSRGKIANLTPSQGPTAANGSHIYNQNAINNSHLEGVQPKVPLVDWNFLGKQSNIETLNVVNFTNNEKFNSEQDAAVTENRHLPIRRQISVDLSQGRQLRHGFNNHTADLKHLSYETAPRNELGNELNDHRPVNISNVGNFNRTDTLRTANIDRTSLTNSGVVGSIPAVPLAQWNRQTNENKQLHTFDEQKDQGQTLSLSTNHQQFDGRHGINNPNKAQVPVDISSVNIPTNFHNGAKVSHVVVCSNITDPQAARDSLVNKTGRNLNNTTFVEAMSPGSLPTVPLVKLDTPTKEQIQYVNISRVMNSNGSVYLNIGNNISVNISQVINTNGTLYLNIGNSSSVDLPYGTGRTILRNNTITHIPDYVPNRTGRATIDVNSSINKTKPAEDTLAKKTNETNLLHNSVVKPLFHDSIPIVPLAEWGRQHNVTSLSQANKTLVTNATTSSVIFSTNRSNLKHHVNLANISNGNISNGTDRPLPSNRSMVNIPTNNPNRDQRLGVAVKSNFNNSKDAEDYVVKKTDNPNHHIRARINCRCVIHGHCARRESCEY